MRKFLMHFLFSKEKKRNKKSEIRIIIYICELLPSILDVAAFPESVNIIEGIDNDIRTPDKLIDGINDTRDGRHAWLAPILPEQVGKSRSNHAK